MIPYRRHRVIVFVNRDHPWFNRKTVRLRELGDEPFVLCERGSTTRRAFEATMQAQGLKVTPVFEIESREGVWKAVERGLGVSVVADFEFVAHPNLRALEIGDHVIKTQYFIAHHSDRALADHQGVHRDRSPDQESAGQIVSAQCAPSFRRNGQGSAGIFRVGQHRRGRRDNSDYNLDVSVETTLADHLAEQPALTVVVPARRMIGQSHRSRQ